MKKPTFPVKTLAGFLLLALLIVGGGLALRTFAGTRPPDSAIEKQSAAIMEGCCKKKQAEKPVETAQTNAAPAKSHCGSCAKHKAAPPDNPPVRP